MFLLRCSLTDGGTPWKIAQEPVDTGPELYRGHVVDIDPIEYGTEIPQGGLAKVELGGFTVTKEAFDSTVPQELYVEIKVYTDGTTADAFSARAYRRAETADTIGYTLWTDTTGKYPSDTLYIADQFWFDSTGEGPFSHYGALSYLWGAMGGYYDDVFLYEYSGLATANSVVTSPVKMMIEEWENLGDILSDLIYSRGCIAEIQGEELHVIDLFSGNIGTGKIVLERDEVDYEIIPRRPTSSIQINGRHPCQSNTLLESAGQTGQWTGLDKVAEVNVASTHEVNAYGTEVNVDIYDVTQDRDTYANNFQMLYERDIYTVTMPLTADDMFSFGTLVELVGLDAYGIVTRIEIASETVRYTMLDAKRASSNVPQETPTWVDYISEITTNPTITSPDPVTPETVRQNGVVVIEFTELSHDIMGAFCYVGDDADGEADTQAGWICGTKITRQDGKQRVTFGDVAGVTIPKMKGFTTHYYIGVELHYRRGTGFADVRVSWE